MVKRRVLWAASRFGYLPPSGPNTILPPSLLPSQKEVSHRGDICAEIAHVKPGNVAVPFKRFTDPSVPRAGRCKAQLRLTRV